jgi:hypothetical protein
MLPPVVVSPLAPMALEPEPEEVSVEPVPLAPIVLPLEPVSPLAPIVLLLEPVLPVAPLALPEPLLAVSLGLVVALVEPEPVVPEEPEVCATAMPPSAIAAAAASAVSVCLVVIISTP